MRACLLRASLLVTVLALPGAVHAGEPRQTVTVEARDVELREVVQKLARDSGRTVTVDPRVSARITLTLREVSWRDAVSLLAERAGCEVQALPGGGLYLTRPPRVSIQLAEARLSTALLLLARLGGRSIVIGPDVQGRATLDLRDVSWARALRAVAATHGFAVLEGEDLVTVGQTRGAAPPGAEAPVLVGTFRERSEAGLRLELEGGRALTVGVPAGGPRRERLEALLRGLRPGDRVAVSLDERGVELRDLALERR